jgi:hypothetical protein
LYFCAARFQSKLLVRLWHAGHLDAYPMALIALSADLSKQDGVLPLQVHTN